MDFNFWFLAFCSLLAVVCFIASAYDNLVLLVICFGLFFGITQYGFKYDLFSYVQNNIGLIVVAFGVYLLLGICWAFFRWWKFVHDKLHERNKSFSDFCSQLKSGSLDYKFSSEQLQQLSSLITPEMYEVLSALKSSSNNRSWRSESEIINMIVYVYFSMPSSVEKPLISTYKDRFIGWFLFWPFSSVAFFISDFMRELVESIYYFCARKLQSISDNIWKED